MKKIIIFIFFILIALPAFSEPIMEQDVLDSKPIEATVTFDWISKTQIQRDENIKTIQNTIFSDNTVFKYKKNQFEKEYKPYWKNENFLNDYDEIKNGKKEDADKYYCGFYVGKIFIAYGIQYKNNLKNIYYYDAMGGLRWVDVFSENYPKFPYYSYQYYRNGEMIAAYYYVSAYDQYVFDPKKKFLGRWYKENLYNRKAKVTMTRTNW